MFKTEQWKQAKKEYIEAMFRCLISFRAVRKHVKEACGQDICISSRGYCMSIAGLLASSWAKNFNDIKTLEEMKDFTHDNMIWPISSHWPYTLSETKEKTEALREITEESILNDWEKDESKKENGIFY
jgi:hypothetical protein